MKPAAFKYSAPDTLEEALGYLSEYGEDAVILAGGQSLLAMMNLRMAKPAVVIDLGRVPGLSGWRSDEGATTLLPMLRQRSLETDAELARVVPLMAEAARHIGHPPTRCRGTIIGSLCHADPAAELPLCALIADAELTLESVRGTRVVAAAEFFEDVFTTALLADELVSAVRLGQAEDGTGCAFAEVSRRHGDFALAAAGCTLSLDEDQTIRALRLAVAGVASKPLRLTTLEASAVGETAAPALFRDLGAAVAAALDPPSDSHASAAYRRSLAGVLVERVLAKAARRAGMRED